MILEYLQPDPSPWDALTVLVRAAYYAATLIAAGLVLFLAVMHERINAAERSATLRALRIAVIAGVGLSLLALALRAIVLSTEGLVGAARVDLYPTILASRIGDAFWLRLAGLLLVLAALVRASWALPMAAIGAFMVVASYVTMGHTTLYRPRQELVALVLVHLLAVSFWAGSLLPLAGIAQRADTHTAAAAIEAWSRIAQRAVIVLAAAGLIAAWYLVGRFDLLVSSWYGWGLLAKVGVVSAMFAFAVRHKLALVPALAAGEAGAGARLARSIRVEFVIALIVFYVAAEMVSVHPVDYGHRIPAK
jgi:copper resistance protein D